MEALSLLIVQRGLVRTLVTASKYPRGASLMALGRAEVVTRSLALVMTTISSTVGKLVVRMPIGSMVGRAPV